ncbi:ABC-type amino acid transport [Vibrio sp. JCM 19236]|nr:ABC-type amino acid transport [Vibrio sp. JCM 19236]
MVDLIKILSLKTGLDVTFINGFTWKQLVENFRAGQLDVLHPVSNNQSNRELGNLSRPLARFDFALATGG